MKSSVTAPQSTESKETNITAITASIAAVLCTLFITVLAGYALKLRARRLENNVNNSDR